MARQSGYMVTWNDLDAMVSLEGYQYQEESPATPNDYSKCATKFEIESYISANISGGTYASNQLVPYNRLSKAFIVLPSSLSWLETGSVKQLTVSTDNSWTASESVSWLSLSATSGTGNTVINVTATTNTGLLRSTSITFTDTTTLEVINISVTQAAFTAIATDPIGLAVQETSSGSACAVIKGNYETVYIPQGQAFATCTHIYTTSNGSVLAGSGWYSDGDVARNWTGTVFTGSNVVC